MLFLPMVEARRVLDDLERVLEDNLLDAQQRYQEQVCDAHEEHWQAVHDEGLHGT